MLDLLKTAAGKNAVPFVSWIFPSGIMILAMWFFLKPLAQTAYPGFTTALLAMTTTETVSWLIGTSVVIGTILGALSTPLYRLLEGYTLPYSWQDWLTQRQKNKFNELKAEENKIEQDGADWKRNLLLEKLARYPCDEDQIAPTRFANSLRSFEVYGSNRYNLDSQILWSELCAVAPASLVDNEQSARSLVDAFVAATYLALIFAITAMALLPYQKQWILLFLAYVIVPIVISRACYEMAIISSSNWSAIVQALVNIGRKPLAKSLGLKLPTTLDDERKMWEAVVGFLFYGDDPANNNGYGKQMDRFRDVTPEKDESGDTTKKSVQDTE